jgi:hypothetical protein
MILMRANPFRGPLEGVAPENQDFLGPEKETSEASAIWVQKKRFSGPTPSNGPWNGCGGGGCMKCIYFVPLPPPPPRAEKKSTAICM